MSQSYTTDSVISADGARIGYRQMGTGPGLILVHGGMQYSNNLMRLAEALSDTYRLYVPDRRGRGLSGPHGDHHNMAKECEDIQALMDKTGAAYIFGLSVGALIVLQASLILPGIRKAALYEPPLSVDHSYSADWVQQFDREMTQGKLGPAFVTGVKGVQTSAIVGLLPRFILEPLFTLALKRADETKVKGDEVHPKALIPTMHFDAQLVLELAEKIENFRAIQAEVLLLGGSKSPAYLKIALDGLGKVLPKTKRVTFSGLDHLGPDNDGKPELVAQELRHFFVS